MRLLDVYVVDDLGGEIDKGALRDVYLDVLGSRLVRFLKLEGVTVDITMALAGVRGYDHMLGKQQVAQQHLRQIWSNPPAEFPITLKTRVSGSAQSLPLIPWIALLDPDVTTTATDGLYIVYLFNRSTTSVYLTMNQGATQHLRQAEADEHKGRAAEKAAIADIATETAKLKRLLDPSLLPARQLVDLGASGFLPEAYEAGTIAAVRYDTSALPRRSALSADLYAFVTLYQACVELKDKLAANNAVRTSSRSRSMREKQPESQPVFRPKDASDYIVQVKAATMVRTRKHEALLRVFAADVLQSGRAVASNVHPRDLTVDEPGGHWLVEAKTVKGNAELAVRAAVGQLFSYRHFLYRHTGEPDPLLLALFDGPIGGAFEALLQSLGIESLCRLGGGWGGSTRALALVL